MKNTIREINPFRIDSIDLENLVIEIGFGNGIYISNLAKLNPNKNFLGIEISGESVKKLSKIIKKEHLENVYIIKMDAYWVFYLFLKDNEVLEIYMNFPDPWPKKKHAQRRLTTIENLYLFTRKLKEGGFIQICFVQ
ncbi:MAG: tRNA (guanosine(46)-N7)-methyltransferase TrmB [candidate division WOR-3 bacterium]